MVIVETNKSWIRLPQLCNKIWLKWATDIDSSKFTKNDDLTALKSKVTKIDVDKLKIVSTDLNKLSNVVKNDVVKNPTYDELTKQINIIQAINTRYWN